MQLLTISEKTQNANQIIGDIIGIFPDSHTFSEHEQNIFTIINTTLTEEEINAKRPKLRHIEPETSKSMNAEITEDRVRMPTINLISKDENGNEVLTPILDSEKPRFDLRFENGEILDNYIHARK